MTSVARVFVAMIRAEDYRGRDVEQPHLFEGEDEDLNDVFLGLQGDEEKYDSSHKGGTSKAGKQAGLDIAKQTGRSCFNELTSSDVVLSEPARSKDANCIVDIGFGTAANANVYSLHHQLGSWASGPKVGTHQLDTIVAKRKTPRGRKQSQVGYTTSSNAGSSSPSNGRGESKTKTKPNRKMARLSSLGCGLESIRETSPVGVKPKKNQNKNTKTKPSVKTKTKAKEKMDQLSASGSGLVFPQDLCLDIDALSRLEIPDDIESYQFDKAAFLEIPMADLLDVNLSFRSK